MFRVSSFAQLAGVSAKVLRDYDEAGLFHPAWVDRQTGYRLYSPAQLPALRRILALRDLGVTLAEIRRLLAGGADLRAVLEDRRRELERARLDAERRLAQLGISLETADVAGQLDVVVRDLADELVATMDVAETGGDDGRAFYELELRIRDAGVRANRPPGELLYDTSGGDGPQAEVFVPVRRAAPGLSVRRLPAVRAATILHVGSYSTMAETRRVLRRWLRRAGLRPTPPTRVIYLQFGAEPELRLPRSFVVDRAADLLTEIQVPLAAA
jgi:DNA-binding transcriptional MerR regulator